MKYAQKEYRGILYPLLFLIDVEDFNTFVKMDRFLKAKESITLWTGFKSNNYHSDMLNYCSHETIGGMANVMALKCVFKETETSLVEFCNTADNLINDIHRYMLNKIHQGYFIRINKDGGHCHINKSELQEYDTIDITEQQLKNFLVAKDIHSYDIEINCPNIVIENDNYTPNNLIDLVTKIVGNITLINNFKRRTIFYKKDDFINLFAFGLKNGLKTISVQTTGQDLMQLTSLYNLLNELCSKLDKKINIYIFTYNKKVFDRFINTDFLTINNLHEKR